MVFYVWFPPHFPKDPDTKVFKEAQKASLAKLYCFAGHTPSYFLNGNRSNRGSNKGLFLIFIRNGRKLPILSMGTDSLRPPSAESLDKPKKIGREPPAVPPTPPPTKWARRLPLTDWSLRPLPPLHAKSAASLGSAHSPDIPNLKIAWRDKSQVPRRKSLPVKRQNKRR
jgi:hypothetical protein